MDHDEKIDAGGHPGHAEELSSSPDMPQSVGDMDKKQPITTDVNETGEKEDDISDKLKDETKIDGVITDPRLKDYPVPLVALTVGLEDDFDEPILTFRFWVLSTFWGVLGDVVLTIFFFKPYGVGLPPDAVALLSWVCGHAMAKFLPTRQFSFFGWKWSMNPGPFRVKEHAMIYVAYNSAANITYSLGALTALQLWYDRKPAAIWAVLYLLTSNFMGYGVAGLLREHLVTPTAMYYPLSLPTVKLFNTMHQHSEKAKQGLKFFGIVATAAFVWTWFPQLIIPVLSSMPLICWMGHGNPKAYVLGSGTFGFGLLSWTFDWNWIGEYVLFVPLWVSMTTYIGYMFAAWFLYPLMYYANAFDGLSYGAYSTRVYTSDGSHYPISKILLPDFRVNSTAIAELGQPHWSTSYMFRFFFGFTATTASVAYAVLYYGKDAWKILRANMRGRMIEYKDPYLQVMSKYPKIPRWWYWALLLVTIVLSMVVFYEGRFDIPWWAFVFYLVVALLLTYPIGIVYSISGIFIGDTMLVDLTAGLLFPGRPLTFMSCAAYANPMLNNAVSLLNDFKFGYYMKVPERPMLVAQLWGAVISPLINYGISQMILDNIDPDVLKGYKESANWNSVATRAWYSASVLWGVIGPRTMFGRDSPYSFVYYGALLGPGLVLVTWGIQRWRPSWRTEEWMNVPVFFGAIMALPLLPTTGFFPSLLISVIFMGYMYRYKPAWWAQYNYLLGIGLACGVGIEAVVQTFGISVPGVSFPTWWGNNPDYPDRCFPPNDKLPLAMQQ